MRIYNFRAVKKLLVIRIQLNHLLIAAVIFSIILAIYRQTYGERQICENLKFMAAWCEKQNETLPTIYAITPTYARLTQEADLTRISHILRLVPNLYWILVEDSNATTPLVRNVIIRTKLTGRSSHLCAESPESSRSYVKGLEQRNAGLLWLRKNLKENEHSIVYFMDEDNSYSIELFAEMSKIEKGRVGIWPVGLIGGMYVEKPLLNEQGDEVVQFIANYRPHRLFAVDMAGFAISSVLFFENPTAKFHFNGITGDQESLILSQITTRRKLQPLANKCRDVLVWHTRTAEPLIDLPEQTDIA